MTLTVHSKYKYFDSTVQRAEDRRQKFHFCRLPFAVKATTSLRPSFNATYRYKNTFQQVMSKNTEKRRQLFFKQLTSWRTGPDQKDACSGGFGVSLHFFS